MAPANLSPSVAVLLHQSRRNPGADSHPAIHKPEGFAAVSRGSRSVSDDTPGKPVPPTQPEPEGFAAIGTNTHGTRRAHGANTGIANLDQAIASNRVAEKCY
jgi:hypothetical protein